VTDPTSSGPAAATSSRDRTADATTGPADATTGPADPAIAELGFDAALAEFQRVVAELEGGGQPLEDALALYERGVALQAHLDRLLSDAELRIRRLVERSGGRLETVEHREDPEG
jgi:exodeoxyribonuclease VII small subunit